VALTATTVWAAETKEKKAEKTATKGKQMFATFETSEGKFKVKLFNDKAPKTVANFAGLADGSKEWTDPKSGEKMKGKSLYNGTIFHRVIPGFMIQGGDPLGKGTGGPGYEFEDEFDPSLKFDKKGLLAMANRGPATNGSQFFVTVATPGHLNNHHTIFGEVVEGYDVVEKISKVPTGSQDKPMKDVIIKTIKIEQK
jgi:peptidyl-prolyl cis-trans isomerase A (cyclophilin A)